MENTLDLYTGPHTVDQETSPIEIDLHIETVVCTGPDATITFSAHQHNGREVWLTLHLPPAMVRAVAALTHHALDPH